MMINGNRMSALPIAEFCGGQASLPNVSGREAVMSSAFHAIMNQEATRAADLMAQLTDDERDELGEWIPPTDSDVGLEEPLRWADAEHELEVSLLFENRHPGETAIVSIGHLDGAWVRDGVAYVADLKRGSWTSEADSLQLLAYGFAYAELRGCRYFVTGTFSLMEGEWKWADPVGIHTARGKALLERIERAARNRSEQFTTGSHCRGCWARKQCPAYVVPKAMTGSETEAVATAALQSKEGALAALLLRDRYRDTGEILDAACKQAADIFGGIPDGRGKVWKPVFTSGRERLDQKKLLEELPEAKKFVVKGKGYDTFRWVKER